MVTDKQNVVRIVQCGSKKFAIQPKFSACVSNNIRTEPEWIPREQSELADYYSRIVDYNDWMLNPSFFSWLDALWGPHTVDQFANPSTVTHSSNALPQDFGHQDQKL